MSGVCFGSRRVTGVYPAVSKSLGKRSQLLGPCPETSKNRCGWAEGRVCLLGLEENGRDEDTASTCFCCHGDCMRFMLTCLKFPDTWYGEAVNLMVDSYIFAIAMIV